MIIKPALKFFLFALFIIYMLLLSKYILFTRMHTDPENYVSITHIKTSIDRGMHKANMKPFKTIKLMYRDGHINTETQYKNLGGNLLGFVPLGIFLPLLFKRLRSLPSVIVVVFAVSLSYEMVQLCTGLGVFDVDDLILNTAGSVIGFIVHFCAALIYRQPVAKTTVEV
jgi:glycopeptide antibiotics resistance protein